MTDTDNRFPADLPNNPCESLLRDVLDTLHDSEFFRRGTKDPHSRFWTRYERVAREYDTEFLEMHNMNLDSLLIFAGLFSAINSAFIVDMTKNLKPDPLDNTNALLMTIILGMENASSLREPIQLPIWPGPISTVIWIQALAYGSLSISLLAAFGAVLGKQWLAHYKSYRFGKGALNERCRRRQKKLSGLNTWQLGHILDALPILLQVSLLLSGISITANVWVLHHTLGIVLVVAGAFGVLFYIFTLFAGTFYTDCPFQNILSDLLRLPLFSLVNHAVIRFSYLGSICSKCGQVIIATLRILLAPFKMRLALRTETTSHVVPGDFTNWSKVVLPVHMEEELVCLGTSQKPDLTDISAVAWVIETSTDPDVVVAVAEMVPMVEWPPAANMSVMENWLLDNFWTCFDSMGEVIPTAGEKAILFLKSLTHLIWQGNIDGDFDFGKKGLRVLERDTNQDTALLLAIENRFVFDKHPPDPDANSDIMWISHMLPYAILRHLKHNTFIPDLCFDIIGRCMTYSSAIVVTNALVSIGLLIGLNINTKELFKLDKSIPLFDLRSRIYGRISRHIRVDYFCGDPDCSWLNTLRLFLPLSLSLISPLSFISSLNTPDIDVIRWGVAASIQFLQHQSESSKAPSKDDSQKKARAALRTVIQGAQKGISSAGLTHDLQSYHTFMQFEHLIRYFISLSDGDDNEAICDILIIIGSIEWSSNSINLLTYISALVDAMAPNRPLHTRYAALRAISTLRYELIKVINNHSLKASILSVISALAKIDDKDLTSEHDPFLADFSWLGKFEQPIFHYLRFINLLRDYDDPDGSVWNQHHFDMCLTAFGVMCDSAHDFPLRDFEMGPCMIYLIHILLTCPRTVNFKEHSLVHKNDSKDTPGHSYYRSNLAKLIPRAWASLTSHITFTLQDHGCRAEFSYTLPLLVASTIELFVDVHKYETDLPLMDKNIGKILDILTIRGDFILCEKDMRLLERLREMVRPHN